MVNLSTWIKKSSLKILNINSYLTNNPTTVYPKRYHKSNNIAMVISILKINFKLLNNKLTPNITITAINIAFHISINLS